MPSCPFLIAFQPAAITWNLMGMMNNCYHRILIFPHRDEETGSIGIRFQHPAPIEVGERGAIGWREEENLRQQALAAAAAGETAAVAPITPDRVSQLYQLQPSASFPHAHAVARG